MKTLTLIFAALLAAPMQLPAAFDHSHAAFTSVLKTHVSGSDVDYAAS